MQSLAEWARATFGGAELGDRRRTARVVQMAAAMMRCPNGSLPAQLRSWAATKAAYRLLDEARVTHAALMAAHWVETRQQASAGGEPLLIIQDTTEIDYTGRDVTGLGPIGNGRGQGFLLHSALAVRPAPREVLGLLYQRPFLRQPQPVPHQSSYQRAKRKRESQVWEETVMAIGPAPGGTCWVHVGDRGSDIFLFFSACLAQACHFLVRVKTERCMETPDGTIRSYLKTFARSLPAQGKQTVTLDTEQAGCRTTQLHLAAHAVVLRPPFHSPDLAPISAWVLRAWEAVPPPEVTDPVEWILVTSLETATLEAIQERLTWYEQRPLIEDYHQCLKTGCRMEQRQLKTRDRLWRLLGVLGVVAVHLLQLREWSRLHPQQLASTRWPADLVALVASLAGVPVGSLTMQQAWRCVAQQGGHLGRRHDGQPGWQTLWKGWLHIQTLLEGMRLAARLPPC